MKAGFAEVDITPTRLPIRTYMRTANAVMDPLYAHAVVLGDGATTVAFLSLDVVIVEAPYVERIKQDIAARCDIPPSHVMVCATHNHACPAVVGRPGMEKETEYIDWMLIRAADAVCEAHAKRESAELGIASGFEARVSFNRRYIMRDGTAISQPGITATTDTILCRESEIDTELGVICVRRPDGEVMGMLVNFACHACHHLGALSAGYPGVLANELKRIYSPSCITVFLNAPCGNIIHHDFSNPEDINTKERMGAILADDVRRIVETMRFSPEAALHAVDSSIPVKYRSFEGLKEHIGHMEKFNVYKSLIDMKWYEYSIGHLTELHAKADHEMATVQAIRVGEAVFASVPAEYFTEFALRIKSQSPVRRTYVVSLANGWLGYIPTREAFSRRGGHETTWLFGSKMAHEAGDVLADEAMRLIHKIHTETPAT